MSLDFHPNTDNLLYSWDSDSKITKFSTKLEFKECTQFSIYLFIFPHNFYLFLYFWNFLPIFTFMNPIVNVFLSMSIVQDLRVVVDF